MLQYWLNEVYEEREEKKHLEEVCRRNLMSKKVKKIPCYLVRWFYKMRRRYRVNVISYIYKQFLSLFNFIEVEYKGLEMRCFFKEGKRKSKKDYPVVIALHSSIVENRGDDIDGNDLCWRYLQDNYNFDEGLFIAPRAPKNQTNLWQYPEICFLIELLIREVCFRLWPDPNRIYLMGHKEGGPGACYVASCLPDKFACLITTDSFIDSLVSKNLRNIFQCVQVSTSFVSSAAGLNSINRFIEKMNSYALEDSEGYRFYIQPIYSDYKAKAFDHALGQIRDPSPDVIEWACVEEDFQYKNCWLEVPRFSAIKGSSIRAERKESNVFELALTNVSVVILRVNELSADFNYPIRVIVNGDPIDHPLSRDRSILYQTAWQNADPSQTFGALVVISR